jgi:3-deoxy-7-phosphoheptulonate synthase
MSANTNWTPQDWKSKPIVQDVVYEDQAHVDRVLNKLTRLPPMVSAAEVNITLFQGQGSYES